MALFRRRLDPTARIVVLQDGGVFEGVAQTLDAMKRLGIALGIVSGARPEVLELLREGGILVCLLRPFSNLETVRALAWQSGYLYVGGDFTNAGGVAAADHVARWDGSWSAACGGLSRSNKW